MKVKWTKPLVASAEKLINSLLMKLSRLGVAVFHFLSKSLYKSCIYSTTNTFVPASAKEFPAFSKLLLYELFNCLLSVTFSKLFIFKK